MPRSRPPLVVAPPAPRPVPVAQPPAQSPQSRPAPPRAPSSGDIEYPAAKNKGLIAVILVVVALASAAGAYFGGVFTH
jgi:hypothetical protein